MRRIFSRPLSWLRTEARPSERLTESEGVLAAALADRLYRAMMDRGGWAMDLGVLGPEAFLPEAVECLRAIELGTVQVGPPTP